jgi:hypothetical protein
VPVVDATRPDQPGAPEPEASPADPQGISQPDGSYRPSVRPETLTARALQPQETPALGVDPASVPQLGQPRAEPRADAVASARLPEEPAGDARGWTDFLPLVGEMPGTELAPYTPVAARWTLALPYDDLRVDAQGRSWVVSVDGQPVADRAAFDALLAASYDLSSVETVDIEMGIGPRGAAPSFVQNATLAAVFDVSVPDGPTFRATQEDGAWVTRVREIGPGVETDLQVGDILLGSMQTGMPFSSPSGLAKKLDDAIAAGGRTVGFAISRDGSNWVASLTLTRIEAR